MFGTNILSSYAKQADIRNVLVIDENDEQRLFISTVLASVWFDAEVEEFDPHSNKAATVADLYQYDLIIVEEDKSNAGLHWLEDHKGDKALPRTILVTDNDNEAASVDQVSKGDGFSERLLRKICNLSDRTTDPLKPTDLKEFFENTAALFDSNANSHNDADTLGNSSAMYIIKLDQFAEIKAHQGQQYADLVNTELHTIAQQWIKNDGANPTRSMCDDSAIYLYVTGMLGGIHGEMVAEKICERVREGQLIVNDQKLTCTVSVGVCLEGEDLQVDISGFAQQAGQAAIYAEQKGGDQFKAFVYSKNGLEREKAHGSPNGDIPRPSPRMNVLSLIKAKRLSIEFQRIVNTHQSQQKICLQPKPAIYDEEGKPCSYSRLAELFSTPGNATQLDRISVIQSLKLLKKRGAEKQNNILLDLSTESVFNSQFWEWLEQQLNKVQCGPQFIFNLNIENFQSDRIDVKIIKTMTQSTRCQFAIRGIGNGLTPIILSQKLSLSWLIIDMEDGISNHACSQIGETISEAHKHHIKVVLRNINSSDKLFCAYSSGADLLQGELASQWGSIGLTPMEDHNAPNPETPTVW